jgi:hypothetical protein
MGKLRGEKDIEATIQRLDRLTLDEGRATAAQTLEVVYCLVQQRRATMDGEFNLSYTSFTPCSIFMSPDADGNEAATGISRALGMALIGWRQSANIMSDWMLESVQEIVSKLNKAERRFIPIPNVHIDDQEY